MRRSTRLLCRGVNTSSRCSSARTTISSFSTSSRFYCPEKTFNFPPAGDSITEGDLKEYSKKEGDSVAVDEVILTIETEKVTVPIRSDVDGVLTKILVPEGSNAKVNQPLFVVTYGEGTPASSQPKEQPKQEQPKQEQTQQQAAPQQQSQQQSQPQQQQAAPQQKSQQQSQPQQQAASKPQQAAAKPAAAAGSGAPTDREYLVKVSKLRQRVAERLKASQNTYALLTTFQECDMTNLLQLREEYKTEFEKTHSAKLGFMSTFIKASAAALKAIPLVNAVLDESQGAIIYRNYIDISVAVATPKGLKVPVLRNCDQKSFSALEKELETLAKKAKDETMTIEEMTGGTFTISNGGVYGSMMGTPIVNPPQSAILGMHAITKRAVVVGDKIEIRPMMYLALTYDHRLIDGKDAVTFLRKIKMGVEDPRRMLLEI